MSRARRPPTPPAFAIWLLTRLTADEALAGDIIEQFVSTQRSRWWLWRQVAIAVLINTAKELQAHPGSLIGIAAGWAVLFAGMGVLALLHPEDGLMAVWLNLWPSESVVWFRWLDDPDAGALTLAIFACGGWFAGRMQSGRAAGLIAFVATISAWSLSSGMLRLAAPARNGLIWYAPYGPATFAMEMATYTAFTAILFPLTALAGGLVGTRHFAGPH
jgi:hypothetical protein